MATPFLELEVDTPSGERTIKVTNPEKTYFAGLPEGRGRKLDLVEYYLAVGDGIVRALQERPTVLKRHPGGSETPAIYQKRVPDSRPPWIETVTVSFPSGRSAAELCPVDVAHVMWAATQGTLDFHPWPTRRDHVELPDELRIDLDPMPGTDYDDVREVALEVQALFDEFGIVSFPKTSGSKGLHVYVRLQPAWTFTEVRHAALAVGREIERRRPEVATAKWWKEERGERVFLDYNRMARDQTIASAYSVRARPVATVSAPLTWDEVPSAEIADFDIWTMRERFAALGDVHAAIDDVAHDLSPLLELYERQGDGEAPYPPQFPKMAGEPLRSRPSVAGPAADKRQAAAAKRQVIEEE
ncbi:MAG: polymerase LigD, polymerase domain protein [Frankiales bacterium]|nr:polymerase LigD, polymerase domain protein [Frankiales bacterium]